MIRGALVGCKGARRGFGSRAALALLLAGALLVCHGLLGASHVLVHGQTHGATAVAAVLAADERPHEPEDAPTAALGDVARGAHDRAHDSAPPETGGAAVTHETAPVGCAEYFAVLLALAGAALLAAPFVSGRAPLAHHGRPKPGPRRGPSFRRSARGPSPPLLQVFRL